MGIWVLRYKIFSQLTLTWSAADILYTRGRNVNPQFLKKKKKKKKGVYFSFKTFPFSHEFDFSDNYGELHYHQRSNSYSGLTYKKPLGTVHVTSCSPLPLIIMGCLVQRKITLHCCLRVNDTQVVLL